ncbi:MAG TPA: glycoside hydrolase family 19 protein [Noviherbaspirillum sp.]|nr:glycoside hydrolase family 19 protein [Noviherbaspirillum sp.]
MTGDQLLAIMPLAKRRVDLFLPHLVAAMAEYEINTPARQAAFLAQIGHESGQLLYVRELASGEAYENRKDLGNSEEGDGVRFKGRGLIQVTGRANYLSCSMALFGDDRLLHFPELLEDPRNACRSAAWFWHSHGLNALADAGNFRRITKLINGGYTHYEQRVALHEKAREVLG